ncbi:hypothetical protein VTH82DRAFT_3112, partial [Thermothelomyces myriococcoides]
MATSTTFTSTSRVPTILVLGGTGTVGSRVVSQLSSSGRPYRILVASRKGGNNNNSNKNNKGGSSVPEKPTTASKIRQ